MKERPILFSGPMIRALLDGRKTRLYCKETFAVQTHERPWSDGEWAGCYGGKLANGPADLEPFYRADWTGPGAPYGEEAMLNGGHWRPSIFMPRRFSRLTLEIVSVRVERLQDISEADARAEGVDPWFPSDPALRPYSQPGGSYRNGFHEIWDAIHGHELWYAKPWVWVVEFKRVEKEAR